MLVLIKSNPDTNEGQRGLKMARDMAADIVLLQNAVYFLLNEKLDGFCGRAYILEEDLKLRGLGEEIKKGLKLIEWEELIDMMTDDEKVIGVF